MLPGNELPMKFKPDPDTGEGKWRGWANGIVNGGNVEADIEADSRAKMLIYLLENKLITA
jgi:hypothetical protein